MKTKVQVALFSILLSVVIHGYLAYHHYPLKFGLGTSNLLCNINELFNCNSVAASNFSSVLGVPLAVWGLITNVILFISVLLGWLNWFSEPQRHHRFNVILAFFSVVASFVMAGVSIFMMSTYCVFCIALYFLSLIYFIMLWRSSPEPVLFHVKSDITSWFGDAKLYLGLLAAVPVLAFLLHKIVIMNYGADRLQTVIKGVLSDWRSSPLVQFDQEPALKLGAEDSAAKMVIVEFADFRCGHCKQAAPSLHAFATGQKDVQLVFKPFPLDGDCNNAMTHSNGISCRLAKAVVCAEKQKYGWPMHDLIFENQAAFGVMNSVGAVDAELKKYFDQGQKNWEQAVQCMESAETHDQIQRLAKEGVRVGVKGTPAIFVNGRYLERGQLVPVLQAVRSELLNSGHGQQ